MIRTIVGLKGTEIEYERRTPKRKAAEIISAAIRGKLECMEMDREYPEMTEREREQVWEQIYKLEERIHKMLGA